MRRAHRGFTLLEIMVVVAIVALATASVTLALRDALPEVQGRQAIIEEARTFVPALQARLAAAGAAIPDAARLALALAAVEGMVWEMIAQDVAAIDRPEAIASLSSVFKAAAGFRP